MGYGRWAVGVFGGLVFVGAGLLQARPAAAQTVVWTLIDVESRLDNDGRLHVVETHHLELREGGGFNLTVEFGLSVDQSIVFSKATRVGPGSEETVLERADGEAPDRYQYYPLGHVWLNVPKFEDGTTLAYRFEYELVNALSPSWAMGAGKGPLVRPLDFGHPLTRVSDVVRDLREARPAPDRLYRLDHDVLFPSRQGPGYEVRRIDYRIAFDTAWKLVDPERELSEVQPDRDYRVRRLFERVVPGAPAAVDPGPARLRWAALLALVLGPFLLWMAFQVFEALGNRLMGPLTVETVATRLGSLAPEEMTTLLSGGWVKTPKLEEVLSRMAGERKIAIEIDEAPPAGAAKPKGEESDEDEDDEDDRTRAVRLRRLVPLESLPPFEREVLARLLPEGRGEASSADLEKHHAEHGLEPWAVVRDALDAGLATEKKAKPPRSIAAVVLTLAALGGVVLQVTSLSSMDIIPLALIADAVVLGVLRAWPRGYWHGGLHWFSRIVLLGLGLLAGAAGLALLLAVNPPLPVNAFLGTALAVVAAYGAFLARARRPLRGEPHATVRDLFRIRAYAQRELRRAQPQLEDRFVPHLVALRLGPAIEAWQGRRGGDFSGGAASEPDGGGGSGLARPFTGRTAAPFAGPPGWVNALYVLSAEEREELEDEE